MRIMAIDYGDARIGLAVSDLLGMICGEAWTMEEWNMERASKRISEEAKKREHWYWVCRKTWTAARGPEPKRAGLSGSC